MKRLAVTVLALTVASMSAACDDDDNPTGPDDSVTFTAQLSPANEVPPITSVEATGSGNVTIRFDLSRDGAGTITAATANFTVNLTGFPSTTAINIAHIHGPAAAGATGPIVVDTGLAAGQVTLTNGVGAFTRDGIAVLPASLSAVQDMLNNPANYYFNVHSAMHGSGVVRGPLVRQ